MQFLATDLVQLNEEAIWQIPRGIHTVTFTDGAVEVDDRRIIYSHYYWRLFREFPGCPICIKHLLSGVFTSDTHQEFGSDIFWDVFNGCIDKRPDTVWEMSRVFYEITNSIYNATSTRLAEYVTTASLHDFYDLLNEPNIKEAKSEFVNTIRAADYAEKVTENAINKAHTTIKRVLYGDGGEIIHNNIKKMCTADIVSPTQMVQLVGPRGFVHDINGKVFKYPIEVGYAEGLNTLYDSVIESRSAAKALFMNVVPLQDSEYFNREMQLLCSVVHSIVGESCTGYVTIPFIVEEGDLQLLKGKYHMVNDKPVLIWDTIDDLVGKTIQMRSITGCGNHDTQTICKTCLGWSHNVIPPETNVGYALVTILCAIISQLMLSTKHVDVSAASQEFTFNERISRWLRPCRVDESRILLNKSVVKSNPIIRLDINSVRQLNNILNADVNELSADRITNCKQIEIVEGDANGQPMGPFELLKTQVAGQGLYLSNEVLQYLKTHSWISTPKYIEFQLKNWDPETAVFVIPRLSDNIYLFLKEVKSFVMPQKKSEIGITDFVSRGKALGAFISLLRKRLKFNITQVEIFVRACMTIDGLNKNYNLPHPSGNFTFMSAKQCLYNRSLTTLLAYETQMAAIIDPDWYRETTRVTHMLDEILTSQ